MASKQIEASLFSPDILEFLCLLHKHEVRYLIVGGEAVIYYGHARLTGDVDFFYGFDEENARCLYAVLDEFWDGRIPGIQKYSELMEEGTIFQFGRPPHRIDLLNQIDGVLFKEAWSARKKVNLISKTGKTPIYYISKKYLIQNKMTTKRPKDLDDLQYLQQGRD